MNDFSVIQHIIKLNNDNTIRSQLYEAKLMSILCIKNYS
jgi:hypothetical protein